MKVSIHTVNEEQLVRECIKICSSAVDESGFVSVWKLAERTDCEILLIPLLVEAAISKRSGAKTKWSILLNCDIYGADASKIFSENVENQLGVRLRNTISHEIAHAIAYELIGADFGSGKDSEARIRSLESLIEKVSPLLLLPSSGLIPKLARINNPEIVLMKLSEIRNFYGTSREVFIRSIKIFARIFAAEFSNLTSFSGHRYGTLTTEGIADFIIRKIFSFRNRIGGIVNPIVDCVLSSNESHWTIVDMVPNAFGVRCKAISNPAGETQVCAIFDLEKAPAKSGESLLYRLRGDIAPESSLIIEND